MHTGKWFTALHMALGPQAPGQGSWHLDLTHARFAVQSEFTTHSGLQPS